MFFDPLYLLFALPGLMLSMLASFFVNSTFSKYSKIRSSMNLTGAQAAERMLRAAGVYDVRIEHVSGKLTDHFDPTSNVLRLSDSVYGSPSLAAVGVACHEAGHALQKANNYGWMWLRSTLVPLANFGSTFSYIVIVLGALFQSQGLMAFGCILFSLAVLFTIVTLPVEWDASSRAKRAMVDAGLLTNDEERHAARVLNAAFMTYVASAVSALLTLLYYLLRSGLLGGRRRD